VLCETSLHAVSNSDVIGPCSHSHLAGVADLVQWTGKLERTACCEPICSLWVSLCSFDFNLHQAILSDLAATWSQGRDDADSSSDDSDNSILGRFGLSDDEEDGDATSATGKQSLSLARCNALIALARYTETQSSTNHGAKGKHAQVVLSMLARLHDISIERCLGAQGESALANEAVKAIN
jgi:hypothetical protein